MEHQLTEEELKERALAAGMKLEDYELAALHERRVLAAMEPFRALIPAELEAKDAAGMIADLYVRLLVERCGPQMAIGAHKELAGSLLALYVMESALGEAQMGADIYLRSVYEPHRAKWEHNFNAAAAARDAKYPPGSDYAAMRASTEQKAVDEARNQMYAVGYFRDSYNATCLFWLLKLSWWGCKAIDEEGLMSPDNCRALLATLEARPVTEERIESWLEKNGQSDNVKWTDYFTKKHAKLCALLRQAIDLNEPLYCSV